MHERQLLSVRNTLESCLPTTKYIALLGCMLLVFGSSTFILGQATINDASLFWIADQGANGQYADVHFDQPLTATPSVSQIHITMKPSGIVLHLSNPRRGIGQPDLLVVNWTSDVLPKEDDTGFTVKIDSASFAAPLGTQNNLEKEGDYFTRGSVQKFYDAKKKEFDDAIAVAKTTQEKDIFAGLSVAAPTSGTAAGDADLSFNRWVTQSLYISTTLNKSSADTADPKHFDTSFTFRKVIPFLFSPSSQASDRNGHDVLRDQNASAAKQFKLLGVLLDGSGRLEGDATNFAVTNAVFNMPVQIASRTMGFDPAGKNGYWQFRLVPAGVEAGHNLGSDNPNLKQYTILRFVTGATIGLIYQPKDATSSPLQRLEFNGAVAGRYLFNDEVAWDPTTKAESRVTSGMRPWYQADLKAFIFSNAQGRAGFKITFIRGSLPPVFAETRAFRFGFIFETSDDKSSQGKPKK